MPPPWSEKIPSSTPTLRKSLWTRTTRAWCRWSCKTRYHSSPCPFRPRHPCCGVLPQLEHGGLEGLLFLLSFLVWTGQPFHDSGTLVLLHCAPLNFCGCCTPSLLQVPPLFPTSLPHFFFSLLAIVLEERLESKIYIYGYTSSCSQPSLYIVSPDREGLINDIRIMWKTDYMMRMSTVKNMPVETGICHFPDRPRPFDALRPFVTAPFRWVDCSSPLPQLSSTHVMCWFQRGENESAHPCAVPLSLKVRHG